MLRHPPLQRLLLRALARGSSAAGGTSSIPIALASAETRGPVAGALGRWNEEELSSSTLLQQQQQRGFASRAPSFLDPQGRRAMKQKRQAKQRQRLLRELMIVIWDCDRGGDGGVGVESSGGGVGRFLASVQHCPNAQQTQT
jgi:hypothetical protein